MPKSKYQKQEEAIERKRRNLHKHRGSFLAAAMNLQHVKDKYPEDTLMTGLYQERSHLAQKKLSLMAEEAHVDSHGNELSY